MAEFAVSRKSGKSNQQVIVEHVHLAEPGTVFTFGQLAAELGRETDRTFDRTAIQQVVRVANHRLLREHQRCLRSVRGVGYTIAFASDHMELAQARERKSRRQIKWAIETIANARQDELTENERAQNAMLMHLYQQQQATARRMSRIDNLVGKLTHRVEQVEGKQQG